MATYGGIGTGFRILILLLLVGILALGGLIWFDYLGLVEARQVLSPLFRLIQPERQPVDVEDPLLLERERLTKQAESLNLQAESLSAREQKVESREQEVQQMLEQLKERETALDNREKLFNERTQAFENRRVNLQQNAAYLVGMPPENAVKILLAMDDQDVIDIFRVTEEQARQAGEVSLVAYWLSLMPPERAAVLQRKMARKVGG